NERNVLVILHEDQIESFHANMIKYLHDNKHGSYYLQTLGDVNEKAAVINRGNLEIVDSELINFIQLAGKGDLLFSNWSDYKPAYVGYNTMLDTADRNLKNHPISATTTVMVILDKKRAALMSEDFYSRFRLVSECPALSEEINLLEKLSLKENSRDFVIAE